VTVKPPPVQPPTPPKPEVKPAVKPPVIWPTLTLTGIVGRGAKGSARINNEIFTVNETIQGVRVVSVGNQGVYLEYMGESKHLKVGGSTQ